MAVVDFPSSPTLNQVFNATNGASYTWDGAVWTASTVQGGSLWTSTGPALTPTDATDYVVIPAADNTQLQLGTRTAKGRLMCAPDIEWLTLSMNSVRTGVTTTGDDATKPSWRATLRSDSTDVFRVDRAPAGTPGSPVTLLETRGSDSKTYCTLADTSVTTPMLAVNAAVRNVYSIAIPNGFLSGTYGSWVWLVTTGNITTRGGWVLVWAQPGAYFLANTTGGGIYTGLARNAGVINTSKYDLIGVGGASSRSPVPGMIALDHPAAGTYTWGFGVLQNNANVICIGAADNGGYIFVAEFA